MLNVDYLDREKSALCIFSDKKQWGYFLPLRLAGYKLTLLNDKTDDAIIKALRIVEKGKIDRVFIFNPYMKSHAVFRGVIEVAKKMGTRVTVIERGGLPNSLYYADEVAYGDDDYHTIYDKLSIENFTNDEVNLTKSILDNLKKGSHSLEEMESYEETWNKHTLLRFADKKKLFIPLQLRDDMAVSYFTDGYNNYESFEESIKQAVIDNRDVIFIIKQHPLSKYDLSWTNDFENVICTSQNDNVHALIDICDAVGLYNSGVGLLAIAHGKPLYNVGNAYYNAGDRFSTRKESVSEIVTDLVHSNILVRDESKVQLFFTWLIFRKYSWFTAQDLIREFKDRKAHAYDNINIALLNLDGNTHISGWDLQGYDYSPRSYLNWHLNISGKADEKKKPDNSLIKETNIKPTNAVTMLKEIKEKETVIEGKVVFPKKNKTIFGCFAIPIFRVFVSGKKKIKLVDTPERFFNESKSPSLKTIGKLSFK